MQCAVKVKMLEERRKIINRQPCPKKIKKWKDNRLQTGKTGKEKEGIPVLVSLIRTILIYLVIVFGLRLMGKRQLGELQPSELVVTILVSNIATLPIENTDIPLFGGIVPILTLVSFEVLFSTLTLKSGKLRKLVSGTPQVIIQNGEIDQREMGKLRFSIDDLMAQLRGSGVFNLEEVALAVVETTGKVSVYPKAEYRPVTPSVLHIPTQEPQLPPSPVICDGRVNPTPLPYRQVSQKELEQAAAKEGAALGEVFLMTWDDTGAVQVVRKK